MGYLKIVASQIRSPRGVGSVCREYPVEFPVYELLTSKNWHERHMKSLHSFH